MAQKKEKKRFYVEIMHPILNKYNPSNDNLKDTQHILLFFSNDPTFLRRRGRHCRMDNILFIYPFILFIMVLY